MSNRRYEKNNDDAVIPLLIGIVSTVICVLIFGNTLKAIIMAMLMSVAIVTLLYLGGVTSESRARTGFRK